MEKETPRLFCSINCVLRLVYANGHTLTGSAHAGCVGIPVGGGIDHRMSCSTGTPAVSHDRAWLFFAWRPCCKFCREPAGAGTAVSVKCERNIAHGDPERLAPDRPPLFHLSLKACANLSVMGLMRYDATVRSCVVTKTSTGMPGMRWLSWSFAISPGAMSTVAW